MIQNQSKIQTFGLAIGFIIFIFVAASYIISVPSQKTSIKNNQTTSEMNEFKDPYKDVIKHASQAKMTVEKL